MFTMRRGLLKAVDRIVCPVLLRAWMYVVDLMDY